MSSWPPSAASLQNMDRLLQGVPGIIRPPHARSAQSVYWMYSIFLDESYPISHDEVMIRLRQREIDSRPFFYPDFTPCRPMLLTSRGR